MEKKTMDKTNNNKYDITERDVEELIKFTGLSNWRILVKMFNNPKSEDGEIYAKYLLAKYKRLCKTESLDEMIDYEKLQIRPPWYERRILQIKKSHKQPTVNSCFSVGFVI